MDELTPLRKMLEKASENAYKKMQEDFVSDLSGTTPLETVLAVLSMPVSLILVVLAVPWIVPWQYYYAPPRKQMVVQFIVEYFIVIVPLVLSVTILADACGKVVVSMGVLCVTIIAVNYTKVKKHAKESWTKLLGTKTLSVRNPSITKFRASCNLITAVCILAVDFNIFPRRFAKTERYGFGLMDTGVGLFVVSHAIVAPEARNKSVDRLSGVVKAIQSSLPLILLGFGRAVCVMQTDYHSHVTEYGVHWNFFFTLAVTKILCSVILVVLPASLSPAIALLLIGTHEYLLSHGMEDFIMGKQRRTGFLLANREGICTCLGYAAIYFVGVSLGRYLHLRKRVLKDWLKATVVLSVLASLFWCAMFYCNEIKGVSRRLVNMGYWLWMSAQSITLFLTILIGDILLEVLHSLKLTQGPYGANQEKKQDLSKLQPKDKIYVDLVSAPIVLESISYNGLLFFLLANIMTGIVNLSIQTLYVTPLHSLYIIFGYMFVLCLLTTILFYRGIKLKVW